MSDQDITNFIFVAICVIAFLSVMAADPISHWFKTRQKKQDLKNKGIVKIGDVLMYINKTCGVDDQGELIDVEEVKCFMEYEDHQGFHEISISEEVFYKFLKKISSDESVKYRRDCRIPVNLTMKMVDLQLFILKQIEKKL